MKITHIYAENYKTYRRLDLDLNVTEDRPIILVGGGNGCGKTTLFDAIYHALYGLNVSTAKDFEQLFNAGVKVEQGLEDKCIVLEISFTGVVLNQITPYRLKRLYKYSDGKVLWSVELNMNGQKYPYGVATPAAQRTNMEEMVNKIIAANLPSELSNYFLFDAMKTSDLVKEEQINRLIMKNINSVMGFNKYAMLRSVSESLLAEKKATKLENEKQRQEYERLVHEKQRKETELNQMREDYKNALEYSNDNKERYEQMKQGRTDDDTTRAKIKQQEEAIKNVERSAAEYRQTTDQMMKDLELNVLFPKLAHSIKAEVELVLNERKKLAEEKGVEISDEQLSTLTREVVALLQEKYHIDKVDVEEIVARVKVGRKHGDVLDEKYKYLSDVNVKVLEELVRRSYVNPFPSIDAQRESLNIDMSELPKKKQLLADYRRSLSGNDYSIITYFEDNEQKLRDLQQKIQNLEYDIKKLANDIAQYDYDIPPIPDPQYDMLCKMPEFFKNVSMRLLAAKRKNIEDMMKEQLNLNLVVYAGMIGRVDLSAAGPDEISFKIYHKNGNEIFLSQLNAGAKQTVMQVLLKVLYELGDYDPPVMIDTVMGVLDKESREVILEHYFPDLAEQTILLSTDTEITTERDFVKLEAYVAKAYTLHRDKESQCTTISNDYFGLTLND